MHNNEQTIAITIRQYDPTRDKTQWDTFVNRSMNGTVFHSQQFLDYHPDGRFQFHHLLFYNQNRLIAVLPGGIKEYGTCFESPLGASYGSFVVEDISTDVALAIISAFEEYIRALGIKKVLLTCAPVIYQPIITQNLDFALLYKGFLYQRHYISHAIELLPEIQPFERFQPTARKHIRRVLTNYNDVSVEEVDANNMEHGLEEFYPILIENKAKFGAKPTHTLEELVLINRLLPGFMKLFLVRQGMTPVAGSLLFLANKRVALIFYHMLRYEYNEIKPIYLLMDAVTKWSWSNGYRFVDIGVSQDTHDNNPMTPALSLIRFKEKFDSRGLLRSTLYKSFEND